MVQINFLFDYDNNSMNLELLAISTWLNKPRQDWKLTSTDKYK